jgi:hypothetical protein
MRWPPRVRKEGKIALNFEKTGGQGLDEKYKTVDQGIPRQTSSIMTIATTPLEIVRRAPDPTKHDKTRSHNINGKRAGPSTNASRRKKQNTIDYY